jgi:hypothetical protein
MEWFHAVFPRHFFLFFSFSARVCLALAALFSSARHRLLSVRHLVDGHIKIDSFWQTQRAGSF